jgi:hypothetical protein
MSDSVAAGPQFEPAYLIRTESGEKRLALHKNHEERAQAVRAMRGCGMTAHGAKRPLTKERSAHFFMLPNKSLALTTANSSSLSEIASKFVKFCWVLLPGNVTWGRYE